MNHSEQLSAVKRLKGQGSRIALFLGLWLCLGHKPEIGEGSPVIIPALDGTVLQEPGDQIDIPIRITVGLDDGLSLSPEQIDGYVTLYPAQALDSGNSSALGPDGSQDGTIQVTAFGPCGAIGPQTMDLREIEDTPEWAWVWFPLANGGRVCTDRSDRPQCTVENGHCSMEFRFLIKLIDGGPVTLDVAAEAGLVSSVDGCSADAGEVRTGAAIAISIEE